MNIPEPHVIYDELIDPKISPCFECLSETNTDLLGDDGVCLSCLKESEELGHWAHTCEICEEQFHPDNLNLSGFCEKCNKEEREREVGRIVLASFMNNLPKEIEKTKSDMLRPFIKTATAGVYAMEGNR